ncbi:hypothetical protein [Christiangramia echinicola]|uniref:Uncharacterized protein n=1 Tax=Christiangramia echinicola TaxID=279359 RepID=A0A1H1PLA9_9FLAO|nr:hypothetical protein [Christiangramia echinicola]SDS12062.1 hypothetical protein SAMN04488552_2163 [Christiangramia echinicola]
MKTENLSIILMVVVGILLIPFIGMQVSEEVNWTGSDFLIMGILLFLTGLAINFALIKFKTLKSRIIACAVILFVLIVIWAELAVGIFGTPIAGS